MIRRHSWFALALAALAAIGGGSCASRPAPPPERAPLPPGLARRAAEFAQQLAGLERRPGLFDLHLDRDGGKVLAVLPAPDAAGRVGAYLYVEGILTGLGSNPVGLDRGQLGPTLVVELRRMGRRVLLEAVNPRFRADGADGAEADAVRESFATSVLWATDILGEDAAGRLLIDLGGLLLRDAHGVATRLADAGQGSFALDRERSAIDEAACLAFPDNVELESLLTFAGSNPGEEVRATAPAPTAISLTLHQSFLRLPDAGYRPRRFDPRMGSYAVSWTDYAAPLDGDVEQRRIARHRLEKSDPGAARSAAREPIVYYVDRGAPEPVRSALVDGASWWAKAFAAAGFDGAFRVELLPPGAHPLDARYNVIQWVHRATRGWSYGGGVIDPRTGEIVKGHVSLGSLRVRHDRLLFEGLLGAERSGTGSADDPIRLSLARLRQLAAHEVGHTLGFAHNFAASTRNRASVMDYPAPLVTVGADGGLDVSRAYAEGVGEWDVATTRWAYSEFAPGADEATELARVVRETLESGQIFLSDDDARPAAAANPAASLWDNGADPVAQLAEVYRVRERALERFGARNLRAGTPLARLEDVLATVYLHHRYQLAAAAKAVGGIDYRHALAGDGQRGVRVIGAERQRRALGLLLDATEPRFLDLPDEVLRLLTPRPPENAPSREQFGGRTGPAFDALGVAATGADLVYAALFEPARAARLVDFHRRDADLPALEEVVDTAIDRAFVDTVTLSPRQAEIARVVQRALVDRLVLLAEDADAAPWVRSRVDLALGDLLQRIDKVVALDDGERAHFASLAADIGRHLARSAPPALAPHAARRAPPGDPIGAAGSGAPGAAAADECDFEALH